MPKASWQLVVLALASPVVAAELALSASGCGSDNGSASAGAPCVDDARLDGSSDGTASDGGASDGPLLGDGDLDGSAACTNFPCATQLALGGTHACARFSDGTARCWGSNSGGESGGATDAGLDAGVGAVSTPSLTGVVRVAAGGQGQLYDFSCAVLADGGAQCWGNDRNGQLARGGDGGADISPHPAPQPALGLSGAIDIAAGGAHACALLASGRMSCWGLNVQSQLGQSVASPFTSIPAPPLLPSGGVVLEIATGQFHTCALLNDGTVSCWGENAHGQLGRTIDGGGVQDNQPAPVVGLSNVAKIAAGNYHSCAILDDGLLLCWGENGHGQTGRGLGGTTIEPSPAIVAFPAGTKVAEVSAGLLHTCAVLTDGTVWCWGANLDGAIGTGDSTDGGFNPIDVVVPTPVKGLPARATSVSAGYLHTCALLVGGQVWCWGSNQFGELGGSVLDAAVSDTRPHPTPLPVKL